MYWLYQRRIVVLLYVLSSPTPVSGLNPSAISLLHLDFLAAGGSAYFTGTFDALSTYNYQGSIFSTQGTRNNSNDSSSVRAQLPDGTFIEFVEANGAIETMCIFESHSHQLKGAAVAGNFTTLGGMHAEAVALFNVTTGEVIPLPGLKGRVQSLLCDDGINAVYVVGKFRGAGSSNVLVWEGTEGWSKLLFGGTNGYINTVAKTFSGNALFGGSFNGLANSNYNATLNGIIEYCPWNLTYEPSSNTPIMDAALQLDDGAIIEAIQVSENDTFVAGNFTGPNMTNIFKFSAGNARGFENEGIQALPGGGLNGPAFALCLSTDSQTLYVGGNFSNTMDGSENLLTNVGALVNHGQNGSEWALLGAGVDGSVYSINTLSLNTSTNTSDTIVIVNGDFSNLLPYRGSGFVPADGIGVWVPSQNNWLANLNMTNKPEYDGKLVTSVEAPDGSRLFAGTLSSWILSADGLIGISYDSSGAAEVSSLGLEIQAQSPSDYGGIVQVGLYDMTQGRNMTIVGGNFTAQSSSVLTESQSINNVAIIDHNLQLTYGISEFNVDAHVLSLAVVDSTLFVGGQFAQEYEGQYCNGLITVKLPSTDFEDTQPPSLTGPGVTVYTISAPLTSNKIYVGGNFSGAGDQECPGVCVYDTTSSTWTRPGDNLEGIVTNMLPTGPDSLVAIGDSILVDGKPVNLASYYAPSNHWTPFNEIQPLDGTVQAIGFAPMSSVQSATGPWASDQFGFWIAGIDSNGTHFLKKWDGSSWHNVTTNFGNDTIIRGLEVVQVIDQHLASEFLDPSTVLLLLGNITILSPDQASTSRIFSALIFNGTDFIPYIATKTRSGTPGSLSSMFQPAFKRYQQSTFQSSQMNDQVSEGLLD